MKKTLTVMIASVFVFQIGIFPVFAGNTDKTACEEQNCTEEWIISGDDETENSKYSYKLVIRPDGTLTFDNDLEITYQGITGSYQLNYEIEDNDDHIMIVTGNFEDIITASPLLEKLSEISKDRIITRVSDDSYSYQLILRTKEGFSFKNILRFFLDSELHGYSIDYSYDLLTDKHTVKINDIKDTDR